MAKQPARLTRAAGVEGAAGASRTDPRCPPAHALRRGPAPRRALRGRGRRSLPRLLEASHHRRDPAVAPAPGGGVRAARSASTRCSAARRSTSPRSAPCLHVALRARRASSSIVLDGENVVPKVHEVLERMERFSRTRARRLVEGAHRQAHPQRHQHRHRRLRPGAGDGLRGAAPLQRSQPHRALRLQRRRHRLRRGDARPRSGGDALRHLLEDLHHARDHDQRAHGARVEPRAPWATRRRSPSTSSRCRRTRRRCGSSASTRRTCSASGTGSAGATRWTRRSASRP